MFVYVCVCVYISIFYEGDVDMDDMLIKPYSPVLVVIIQQFLNGPFWEENNSINSISLVAHLIWLMTERIITQSSQKLPTCLPCYINLPKPESQ